MKRIIISYPSTSQFFNFIERRDYPNNAKLSNTLKDFFESSLSNINPNVLDTDFNILVFNTNTKSITGDVKDIVEEYERKTNKINKNIKIFSIDYTYPIDIIGELPQITNMIPKVFMESKFSIIICQYELLKTSIITHLKDYLNTTGIMIMDKNKSLNYDNIQGWNRIKLLDSYHTFEPIVSHRDDLNFSINDFDITLETFKSYNSSFNNNITGIDEYLSNFIKSHVQHNVVNVMLSKKYFNILVMCSDEHSIRMKESVKILQKCINEIIDLDEIEIYHIGKNILIEDDPFIRRCYVNNYHLMGNVKFDLIISDNCPVLVVNSYIDSIYDILKNDGGLILPKTKKLIKGFIEGESDCEEYSMFIKTEN